MKNLDSFLEENEAIQKMMQLKSNLILEAEWLKANGDLDDAKKKYARAAEKEYQIYQILQKHRYSQDVLINLLSGIAQSHLNTFLIPDLLHEQKGKKTQKESIFEDLI